jgi:hypothetical protein
MGLHCASPAGSCPTTHLLPLPLSAAAVHLNSPLPVPVEPMPLPVDCFTFRSPPPSSLGVISFGLGFQFSLCSSAAPSSPPVAPVPILLRTLIRRTLPTLLQVSIILGGTALDGGTRDDPLRFLSKYTGDLYHAG